jgi:hypothetical protein
VDLDVVVDLDLVPDVVMVARVFLDAPVDAPKSCALPNKSLCSVSSDLMHIAQP